MNVELINTIKNKIGNKDYDFSNYEVLLIFSNEELLSYLKKFLAEDYNNWNYDIVLKLFPEMFNYIDENIDKDLFYNYLLCIVHNTSGISILLDHGLEQTIGIERLNYLKSIIHSKLKDGIGITNYITENELEILLDNKYYLTISKVDRLYLENNNINIFERLKKEYPFNKLSTPLFLKTFISYFTDSLYLFDLSTLINYASLNKDNYNILKDEINKRLTDINEVRTIKDFYVMDKLNLLLIRYYDLSKRAELEKLYQSNGIYFFDNKYPSTLNIIKESFPNMINNALKDEISYNSLKYLVQTKQNKELNAYLQEHLDIFIKKGEFSFIFNNFKVSDDIVNYFIKEITVSNEVLLDKLTCIDSSIYKNIQLFRTIVNSGRLKELKYDDYYLTQDEYKKVLINWIKNSQDIDILNNDNSFNSVISDEEILIALLESNNINISISSIYNVLDLKDISPRLLEVVKNAIINNNDYALKLLGLSIFNYEEIVNTYLDKDDIFKDKLIELVNHNEGLEYSENFYQKVKDYLVRKYNIKLENLDYLESKFGPNIIRYIDNENIQTLINMDKVSLTKITDLFPQTKFNMQDMESTYDAIKQYEFYQNNPNIVQIFPNMLHMIEDDNDDYYIYLMELYKVIDKDFFNNFWQKYDNRNKEYYEDNPHELLLLITEKIKNSPKKEKYIDMLHLITNYYISKKRIEYRTKYNVYKDLNVDYEYNKKQLFEFTFYYSIKTDLTYFNKNYEEQRFINVLKNRVIEKGISENLFNSTIDYIKGNIDRISYDEKEIIKTIKLLKEEAKFIFDDNYSVFYQNEFMIEDIENSKKVKKEYIIKETNIDIYKILSSLRYDILKEKLLPNENVYTSLLNTMKKRKIHLMPDILKDYLDRSNIDLKYSDDYLESFISFYYLIYEKEQRLLIKDNKDLILKLPSVLKNAETFASVSSVYSQILTNEDARLIRANDGPNRATRKLMNNERLKEAVSYTLSNYKRVYNLVPPVNEVFDYNGKKLRCVVGNFTNPCNITHGERTGACMRIGGVGESLYNFVLKNEAGFHIRFENPLNGEYISRVSGFRNGNTLFLNELRDSLNMKDYSNFDLYNICKLLGDYLINITKNDKVPIENVVLHKAYASEGVSDRLVNLNVSNIKEGLPPFYTDVSNNVLVLATSSKEKPFELVKLGNEEVPKYLTCRDNIIEINDKEKMIEVANRVHSIKLSTQNNSIENIDIIEIDDNFVYGICNHDWYIYVDKNNKIYHEIISIDSRAIEEYNNALMAIEEKFNLTKEGTTHGL